VSELEYLKMAWLESTGRTAATAVGRRAGADAHAQRRPPVRAQSTFVAADREVDRGTGTIRLVAAFANPGNVLRPASTAASAP